MVSGYHLNKQDAPAGAHAQSTQSPLPLNHPPFPHKQTNTCTPLLISQGMTITNKNFQTFLMKAWTLVNLVIVSQLSESDPLWYTDRA